MSEAPKFVEWQPIETAPKDGTVIFLCSAHEAALPGKWDSDRGWRFCLMLAFDPPSWIYVGLNPTHWMHLPEPPKALFISPTDRENLTTSTQD